MANVLLSTKAVGSTVKLKVNGTAKEFIVVHQGKPSSLYDNSCDGTWLLMKDIYENRQWHNSNVNNLENSTIHSYLNGTFLNLFESNIRDAIKQVKLPYRKNGGSGGSDQSGANGLLCKIFLLSGYEIGFTTSDNPYFPVDGAKLSYFEAGTGSSALNKRIAYLNGSAANWWLRSPVTSGTIVVWIVYSDGSYNSHYNASYSGGIRPALILPSTLLVSDDGTVKKMNRNLNEAIFDIAKVEAIMFAFENTYLELDVAPADRARADMATDAFYALWDAIRKVSDDLDRLAGDCRVVDAIYAVNDVRRRVGTLKTED